MQKRRGLRVLVSIAIVLSVLLIILGSFNSIALYLNQPNSTIGKDSYIRQDSLTNFGSDTAIKVGETAGGKELRGLLYFNISDIPSGNSIISAKIGLYKYFSNTNNNVTINIYKINKDWNESFVNWFNVSETSDWTSAGGDHDLTLLDSVNITNSSGWFNFSISEIVREWYNGSANNYGLILIPANATIGDFVEFYSSNYEVNTTLDPIIYVDYSSNAPPSIIEMNSSSQLTKPANVGEEINFSAIWSDIDSSNVQLFVCNSTAISPVTGCLGYDYCNTSLSTENPQICSYIARQNDNRTSPYWTYVCDGNNCSESVNGTMYVNHKPNLKIIQPNGGEGVNQSQGNYKIFFNVSDIDGDNMIASIYYGENQNSTTYSINLSLNLTQICTDGDGTTITENNCTYIWNSTGIVGAYYLTIIANDSHATTVKSSDNYFNVYSLFDYTSPKMNSSWIDSARIFSGKIISIYANITEENMKNAWVEINTTPIQYINMTNLNNFTYIANFIVPEVGQYNYIIHAIDRNNNANQTNAISFNVSKPNASVLNLIGPNSSLPYTVIRISSEFNASDGVKSLYAYLNVPDGFIFLGGYPQNALVGNLGDNQSARADWFILTPNIEGSYKLNVSYSDGYSNTWQTTNTEINVSYNNDQQNIYSLSADGYPEVQTASNYYTEASFYHNGLAENPDRIEIMIYDSLGNLVSGPVLMNNKNTGKYNSTYTVGSAVNEGEWQCIINATKNGVSYYTNEFFRVIGGPFDVRNITIDDPAVNKLRISVISENTGGVIKDLTLLWNLTREDNGNVLESGADTFAVNAYSEKNWTIYPNISYVGQVRITFIGYYSGTEKAGAYKIFSTSEANQSSGNESQGGGNTGGGSTGGGGGGGGNTGGGGSIGGGITPINKNNSIDETKIVFIYDNPIYIAKNINKKSEIIIENNDKLNLTNVILTIEGLNESYSIQPQNAINIDSNGKARFNLSFDIHDLNGENEFYYILKSDQINKKYPVKMIVLSIDDYFKKEMERLNNKANGLSNRISDEQKINEEKCKKMIDQISRDINSQSYIDAKKDVDDADECLNELDNQINNSKSLNQNRFYIYIFSGLVALLFLGTLIILLFKIYRKIHLISNFRNSSTKEGDEVKDDDDFDKRLKDIEDKIGK